jgi:hydrogenase maturation factor
MTRVLRLGKVSKKVLKRSVLPFIPIEKDIELDGATVNLFGEIIIAHSPSIGVPIEALGFFAFHYSASNVASKFGRPRLLITGIYLPLNSTEDELKIIAKSLGEEAKKKGVSIIAGQTATYNGLEIPLLTTTCIGEIIREPEIVCVGDKVLLVGRVGGEALWLDGLSKGKSSDIWKNFTPLHAILNLQENEDVKLMHDVSEGGVKGALFEIATSNNYGLNVSSESIVKCLGVEDFSWDYLRAPSYGVLIVIAKADAVDSIKKKCRDIGSPCSLIGEVIREWGLIFDGKYIQELSRIEADEIYGNFEKKKD